MTGAAKRLLAEVLALPTAERAKIAGSLLQSLEDERGDVDPQEWDRAWSDEIALRVRSLDDGTGGAAPADEALARIFRR